MRVEGYDGLGHVPVIGAAPLQRLERIHLVALVAARDAPKLRERRLRHDAQRGGDDALLDRLCLAAQFVLEQRDKLRLPRRPKLGDNPSRDAQREWQPPAQLDSSHG